MKKIVAFLLTMTTSLVLLAQEEMAESVESTEWSDDTKWKIVTVFAIVVIVLVFRTFRNKPTV